MFVHRKEAMNDPDLFIEMLKQKIAIGEYGATGRLPSIKDLGERYSQTRYAVAEALKRLEAEGAIKQKARSYYVVPRKTLRIMTSDVPSFLESLRKLDLTPKTTNLVLKMTTIPDNIASIFNLSPGIECMHRRDIQGTQQIPYRFYDMWYLDEATWEYMEAIKSSPDYFIMPDVTKDLGQEKQHITELLSCRLPTPEEAKILSISLNAPLIVVQRTNAIGGIIRLAQLHYYVAHLVKLQYEFDR